MITFGTFGLTLLVLSVVHAQRYQSDDGSYLADLYGDYEGDRPVHSTPRSYSAAAAAAQRQAPAGPKPTPVAILKQINRHNEDGSYTYGFEGADGSFKIETKLANGEVKGKYGFVDDGGKVRVVEYGADQYGFQPSGDGITVAPPTLVDETTSKEALEAQKYQDYQDYQQSISRPAPRPQQVLSRAPAVAYQYQPQYPTQQQSQAIYAAQQVRLAPKSVLSSQPIFTPADQQPRLSLQSQLIQSQYYDDQPQYKIGPVQFGPAPVQEQPQARAQPQARSGSGGGSSGGLLDQLARDYALPPDSAAPLHDISFGYY